MKKNLTLLDVIKSLIKNSKENLDLNEFINLFVFEASGEKFMLIPMGKGVKYEDCLMNIFCEDVADDTKKAYMKYYMGGKLFSKEHVQKVYCRGVLFEGNKIRSLSLMIAVGDKVIARIGMGPLTGAPASCTDVIPDTSLYPILSSIRRYLRVVGVPPMDDQ